ncbi:hypothetical protein E2C01_056852 [Portunus trituberculatus]|uniref:Uncharacterized protein n=1 Tax=Portunus trituberculatus TaxID=210409 RepID=A0A5B7GV97_PORTR|nr:hypothetical protein [Portunus trituberculatus]
MMMTESTAHHSEDHCHDDDDSDEDNDDDGNDYSDDFKLTLSTGHTGAPSLSISPRLAHSYSYPQLILKFTPLTSTSQPHLTSCHDKSYTFSSARSPTQTPDLTPLNLTRQLSLVSLSYVLQW